MKVISLASVLAVAFAGATFAADTSTQKTDPAKMSPQSSHPGVQGDTGGKNGPAATSPSGSTNMQKNSGSSDSSTGASTGTSGTSSGSSSSTTAPAGTNVPQASPGADPSHDASGVKGAPGNKNGPAQKPSGQ